MRSMEMWVQIASAVFALVDRMRSTTSPSHRFAMGPALSPLRAERDTRAPPITTGWSMNRGARRESKRC